MAKYYRNSDYGPTPHGDRQFIWLGFGVKHPIGAGVRTHGRESPRGSANHNTYKLSSQENGISS